MNELLFVTSREINIKNITLHTAATLLRMQIPVYTSAEASKWMQPAITTPDSMFVTRAT